MSELQHDIRPSLMPVSFIKGQQFTGVVDLLPDAIFAVDLEGRVIAWNHALETMTGVSRTAMMGKTSTEYTTALYRERQDSLVDYLLTGTREIGDEFENISVETQSISAEQWLPVMNSGHGGWARLDASLLLAGDGNSYGAIQTIRDISQKKHTERALKRVNRALGALSEVNQAMLHAQSEGAFLQKIVDIIVHNQGYHHAWIAYIEDAATDRLRIMAYAGLTNDARDVRTICQEKNFGCGPVGSALDTNTHFIVRNIKRRHGCEKCWQHATDSGYKSTISLPLINDDTPYAVLNIYACDEDAFDSEEVNLLTRLASDLTFGIISLRTRAERDTMLSALRSAHDHLEHKVSERTRELTTANTRLLELDRLKSMFIASMSHELRTPLNSIIGFSGIMLKGMSGVISDKQREHLERVYGSGKHLLELISDVIDIAKIEGDRIEVFPSHISLKDIFSEVSAAFSKQALRKNLTLQFENAHGIALFSDRKRLTQVISNLVSNAIKYTEHGSVSVTAAEYFELVTITVSDTGIGIMHDDMPKLFVAFERIDTHLKIKEGGAGLGLYLTEKLVTEILKGDIHVASEHGIGSTFSIRIAKDLRES